jgi:hypothetical protein
MKGVGVYSRGRFLLELLSEEESDGLEGAESPVLCLH